MIVSTRRPSEEAGFDGRGDGHWAGGPGEGDPHAGGVDVFDRREVFGAFTAMWNSKKEARRQIRAPRNTNRFARPTLFARMIFEFI